MLWGANHGGILDTTAGPPLINFAGNTPYNSLGQYAWPNFGYLTNNRWQLEFPLEPEIMSRLTFLKRPR